MKLELVKHIALSKFTNSLIVSKGHGSIDPIQTLRLNKLYELLILLRIFLTFNIQTGFIDQDEFSQSVEVIAGDYFDLQVFKSPAFNSSFPTRSIAFLHGTIYMPYTLAHYFLSWMHLDNEFQEPVPIPERLLLCPRIFQLLLSFIVDYIMVKFCYLQDKHARKTSRSKNLVERLEQESESDSLVPNLHSVQLVTLASSQILLTFTSRTHAAGLNLILYSGLLYLIADSLLIMDKYLPVLNEYHDSNDPKERVHLLRDLRYIGYSPIGNLHWIGLLVICGTFNDPEFFLSYASVPVFFYLQRGISSKYIGMHHFHIRLFTFVIYCFVFSIPFIIWDSVYYQKLHWTNFWDLNLSIENFVITPANYMISKASSIRSVSDQPKILWNFLIMFNILGIIGVASFCKEFYDFAFIPWKFKPKLSSLWTFLNFSWFIPLILLIQYRSSFDLVPLIFPLVYMHGHKIQLVSKYVSYNLGIAWFLCNIVGIIYWGYGINSGIITGLLELTNQFIPLRFNDTEIDITFGQMSTIPPLFLLIIPQKWKTSQSIPVDSEGSIVKNILRFEQESKIRVFHVGKKPSICSYEPELLRLSQRQGKKKFVQYYGNTSIGKVNFFLLPTKYHNFTQEHTCFKSLQFHYVKTYRNHINFDIFDSWPPSMDFGLNLYYFTIKYSDPRISGRRAIIDPHEFSNIFNFKSESFVAYAVNLALCLFTAFLFFVSFITYAF